MLTIYLISDNINGVEILYTAHAVQRMHKRNLSPREVESVILQPDGKIKQSMDKVIYHKELKGRKDNDIAAVIVQKKNKRMEVITLMVNFEVKK